MSGPHRSPELTIMGTVSQLPYAIRIGFSIELGHYHVSELDGDVPEVPQLHVVTLTIV
jgi:hypothetical protein